MTVVEKLVTYLEGQGLLHRKGKMYFCPFCEDPVTSKSPSFSISEEKLVAKCFGSCGATFSGKRGLLKFVASLKDVPLSQAAAELKQADIDLGYSPSVLNDLMDFWSRKLSEESAVAKMARTRLGVRGVDLDSDFLQKVPVGVFVPPEGFKLSKKLKEILDSLGTLCTVHGYTDKDGEVKALKFIPYDKDFRTLKNSVRVYAPEGMEGLFHGYLGSPGEEVYVVEGEFDCLTMGSRTGLNVIAFGGQTSDGSKVSLPGDRKYVIVPDRFGDKRGEEIAVSYISALGNKEVLVVDLFDKEVEEDPAEMFRVDPEKYTELVKTARLTPAEFVYKLVTSEGASTASDVLRRLQDVVSSLPAPVIAELYDLVSSDFDVDSSVFFRAVRPTGDDISVDQVHEILSKELQIIYIQESAKEEIVYFRFVPTNAVGSVSFTNRDRLYGFLTNLVGKSFYEYLLEKLPLPNSFFYKNGVPRKEKDIFAELKALAYMALDRMKGEAANKGLKGKKVILRRGIYFLEENVAVLVSGSRVFLVKKGGKVEKVRDFTLYDGKYVILPDDNAEDWLPTDIKFSEIKKVNPKETFEKVVKFFSTVIKFPKKFEYQYKILALLTFYANLYDAFKDRVLWVLFNGDSGSGKTTTEKFFATSQPESGLHKLVLNSIFLTNYTPAGLRQGLDSVRALVGLDEAEPEVLDRVMDEFRSMISADSKAVRGTKDQQSVEQENRFTAILSSIALPEKPQNLNRLLIIRFFRFDDVPTPTYTLKTCGMGYDYQRELSKEILLACLKVIHDAPSARVAAEDKLREIAPTISARDAEAYSTLLAVAELLGVDVSKEVGFLVKEMQQVRKIPSVREQIYHEVLNLQLTLEGRGVMAVSEICANIEEDPDLLAKLSNRGIVYKDGWLHLPLVPALMSHFSYNPNTISAYLSTDDKVRFEHGVFKINAKEILPAKTGKEVRYEGGTF